MTTTNIEWADRVWNPVTGCQKVSPGCKHCYAETVANRFWPTQYPAIPVSTPADLDATNTFHRPRRFTDVMTHEDRLRQPLKWRKPSRVFVNSMSDLFHEDVPDAFIDRVFAVMALCPQHTFQVLTKRPDRMRLYLACLSDYSGGVLNAAYRIGNVLPSFTPNPCVLRAWPLPNIWLGVSVEDQQRADERIPLLLQTPAAVRFISAEPLLGPLDLRHLSTGDYTRFDALDGHREWPSVVSWSDNSDSGPRLDWVIVGGESGSGARPCDVAWVRSIVQQCQSAQVPVFVKQLGARVIDRNDAGFGGIEPDDWPDVIDQEDRIEHDLAGTRDGYQGAPVRIHLKDRKGGDPTEWPEDLRVREWPAVRGER